MDDMHPAPLVLCMENAMGEEVSLQIESNDTFLVFLEKAKLLLGFDVDINSITRNQPVSLTDNIYEYLMNSEYNQPDIPKDTSKEPEDLLYILNDGTEIEASQIHFDNDDLNVDLNIDKLPFIKHTDDDEALDTDSIDDDNDFTDNNENIVKYNIIGSPIQKWSSKNGSPNFVNNLPFKLVCNNTSGFEHQFTKYLESTNKAYATLNPVLNAGKSPTSVIRDNFKKYDDYKDVCYTREDVLNMFKDAPVNSLPLEYTERKHVRKTDPSRIHKSLKSTLPYIDMNGVIIGETESQSCYICGKIVRYADKLYLFDNKDQRLHKTQKKSDSQLKVICGSCLDDNFKPCRMKSGNQFLEKDEYLVIRNNQQFIFRKTKNFIIKNGVLPGINAKDELVKVEIGSDGEIVTKSIDNPPGDIIVDGKENSSDVEIIEELDTIIDNLDDADEEVKEFLGKYQGYKVELKELKCRFCEKVFRDLEEASEHCDVHKHSSEDGSVFPCPLCDYGYAKLKWLKAHLRTAHQENKEEKLSPKPEDTTGETAENIKEEPSEPKMFMNNIEVKMEVKQEVVDISDDEIWIVRTADDEAEEQLKKLFVKNKEDKRIEAKYPSCNKCKQMFPSAETLSAHKCQRADKRKTKQGFSICVPTKEDFIKRAQGRAVKAQKNPNSLLNVKPRKRNKSSNVESQVVTCNECNESFNSKVRLKFHMRFHEDSTLLTPDGKYKCHLCKELFDCETTLFDHVHFQHHKNHRWMCPVKGCGKTFVLRATLTKHSRTHTDTRRYVCVTCGKRFLDKQTLDEHGVTHLQIKPFQCHICFKQLTRRSRLRMHMRAHEEEMSPRLVYVCAICSRAFRDDKDAQDHAVKSPECIETFANDLKEENEESTVRLSPTTGLVRESVTCEENSKLSKPVKKQVEDTVAKPLLSKLADEVRCIVRVVQIEKAFRCEYCEDVFYLEDALNAHRLIHKDVKNPFICHICKVTFATYSRCTTHKTTHGFYKRPLQDGKKLNECDSEQSSSGILGYGDFPVVKHFLCEDCGRSYLHWTYLQVHRRMKHAKLNFHHKCSHCNMVFPNSWSMAYHRKKMHGKSNLEESDSSTLKPRGNYRIPCRDCDEVLPNKTELYKHRKKEHSDMTLVMEELQDTFMCGNCGMEYGTRAGLDAHLSSHSNENGVATCLKCNTTFPQISDLQKHLKEAHDNFQPSFNVSTSSRRPFSCEVCGNSFRTLSMKEEHYRVHTGERPFPCDICGVAFRRSTAMRNHRLIHTGIRAWACSQCPKRFRIRSDLMTHLRLKHPSHIAVIEIATSNPTTEDLTNILSENNIPHDRVTEVSKMTFEKNTTSVIPTCVRALSMLSNVPRIHLPYGKPPIKSIPLEEWQPYRRGRGIAKASQVVNKVDQPGPEQTTDAYPMVVNVPAQELSDINMQLLLQDGVIMNGNQLIQIQMDDTVLLQ